MNFLYAFKDMVVEALSELYSLFLSVSSISGFPPRLSADEEKKYIREMTSGDKSARQKLIEHNLRLVAHISKKYNSAASDSDDLISIGTIGLIKAVDTFRPEKGHKLSSYAAICIQNEILMYLRSGKKNSLDISMNEPIDTDRHGNVLTLMDIIAVDDTISDDIDLSMKCSKLKHLINSELDERERDIIIKRYGLDGHKPLTQMEISKKIGISRSYVSRIEKKILERLRDKI
ncbi:MAG: RNA polymerase sporulation sigma factor SigK [Firmicutes bacterium]|nr:RNA polymerase sporulation sigma factor SigK [Bacillota bacterium]